MKKKYDTGPFLLADDDEHPFPVKQTLAIAKDLGGIYLLKKEIVFANRVMSLIIKFTKIPACIICSETNYAYAAHTRFAFWYFMMTRSNMNFKAMGLLAGGREPSTVTHSISSHRACMHANLSLTGIPYRMLIQKIGKKLAAIPIDDFGKKGKKIRKLIRLENGLLGKL